MSVKKKLGVVVDGTPLPEEDAYALWDRFSLYMEEHRGDLAGFARQEGFASIHPGVDGDLPVLRASKTAPQQAYAPAKPTGRSGQHERNDHNDLRAPGGSGKRQGGRPHPGPRGGEKRDPAKKSAG